MSDVGKGLRFPYSVAILYSFITFALSFVGFGGDWEMTLAAVLSLVCWGTYCGLAIYAAVVAERLARGQTDLRQAIGWAQGVFIGGGILAWSSAWVCGFLAFATCGPTWLAPLYHWGGLTFGALAFLAHFLLPKWVEGKVGARPPMTNAIPQGSWITTVVVGGLFVLIWLIMIPVMANKEGADAMKKDAIGGFLLPYPEGTSSWIVQGAWSSANHSDDAAYDFRLACGTDILASADGKVTRMVHKHDGHGGDAKDNVIEIEAHDKSYKVQYGHIKQFSAKFKKDQDVKKGQKIAEVGNVGNSLTGHIHWEVTVGGKTQNATFDDADVKDHDGIPRSFLYYTSSNKLVPGQGNPPP